MGTPRWQTINIADGAYADDTRPFSFQDTVNYLPVQGEQAGTLSPAMLRQVPGMVKFCDTEAGPGRGLRNVEGALFAVAGQHLYRINTGATSTPLGVVPGVSRTRMTHNQVTNGNQLAIPNGSSGYVYDTSTGVFQQITDDSFPGAVTFDFIDQFVTYVAPNRQQAGFSDLANALSYSGLDTVQASASPDKLVGQITSHEQWWLMGERTIQPFSDVGTATGTFTADQGMTIERGCASPWCMAILDNTVFWLGENGVVYRANGYTPQRISNYPIEQAIARCNIALSFAFIWEDRGHAVFYLTFPDGYTWGYDVSSGKWHRRQSYGLKRWMLSDLTFWNGAWYGLHFSNGGIYRLDWSANTEDGAVLERRRTTGILFDAKNRVRVNALELIFDTGQKEPILPITLMGDMPSGHIGDLVDTIYIAKGGFGHISITHTGTLPTGVSIDLNGACTGQFTAAGTFSFTIIATDAAGTQVTLPQTVMVSPMSLTGDLADGRSGTVVDYTYVSTGGAAPVTFSIPVGSLPAGLSIDPSTGRVTGTRTTTGTYNFTVRATDMFSNHADLPDTSITSAAWAWSFIPQTTLASSGGATAPPYFDPVSGLVVMQGAAGDVWTSADGGATWTRHATGLSTLSIVQTVGSFMGALLAFGASGLGMRRSTDGGATWNPVLIGGNPFPDIQNCISSPTCVVAMNINRSKYSTDGGVTWTDSTLPSGFNPGDSGLAFGGLYINAWNTWVCPGQGAIYEAVGVGPNHVPAVWTQALGSTHAVATTAYSPTLDMAVIGSSSGVYYRTRSGSWTYINIPSFGTASGIAWEPELGAFVASFNGTVMMISFDGLTWTNHTMSGLVSTPSTMIYVPLIKQLLQAPGGSLIPYLSNI